MEPACGLPAATSAKALEVLTTPACCRATPMVRPESPACTTTVALPVPGAGPVLALGQPGHHGLQDLYGEDAGPADERERRTAARGARGRAGAGDAATLLRGQRTAWPPAPRGAGAGPPARPGRARRRPRSAPRRPGHPASPPCTRPRDRCHRRPRRRRRWSSRGAGPSSVLAPCPVPGLTGPAGPSAGCRPGCTSSPGRTLSPSCTCSPGGVPVPRSPSRAAWRMSTAAAWSTTARCLRPATPLSRSVLEASTVDSRSSTRRTGTGATSAASSTA